VTYTPAPIEAQWAANVEAWQGNDVDVCSKISDAEKGAWINATLALQAGPSNNMAVATATPEVSDSDDWLLFAHLTFALKLTWPFVFPVACCSCLCVRALAVLVFASNAASRPWRPGTTC
jgi:hypothetical protein